MGITISLHKRGFMKYGQDHALNKYSDDYPEQAIAFLAKGKSYAALAAHLDVSQRTLDNWRKAYPDFDDAVERGRDKGQALWEQDSDDNMQNKDYCSTRYIFKMKSQYKVKDGSEPIKQDNTTNTHMLFGLEGEQHLDLVKRVMSGSQERGE
jgi:hypothetical protein